MASEDTAHGGAPARAAFLNDPKIRGLIYQVVVFAALVAVIYWIIGNTTENLRRSNISSGFAFLNARSGFDIAQTLIPYSSNSRYIDAFVVGLLNTLLVAVSGIVLASILGFIVGIGRLSRNWLIRKICTVYVEVFRNIPPLLVIFFWYFAVLQVLPPPRDSIELPFGSYLNARGFFLPRAIWGEGSWLILLGLVLGIAMSFLAARWARTRQAATGQQFPVALTSIGLIVGLPVLAYILGGFPVTLEFPQKSTFNLTGGWTIKPEFLSLFLALSFYTASFIAEIVRAGILGVSKGQTEASYAVGLRPGPTLRLVVIPQALRIIIPPLTSQYLNLTKNSSLAVAIGYPDLVAVGQTAMNQTGQAIEVVAIWMVIYLGLSLATSVFMNWFNARMALVER
ncbi:amino acid ABC transporter permease [Aquamicrobium sp. LC103]|uniref:amino acid ABC transporter permease n=1 Tax=Aquamicrobium sp. LC103 TaxID=1120658 RepID=UPI00063E82CF|nr:amino acid ABC transporter permease [Aquamicrobium sp. LC103]TKT81391.1 amino acid ABC transporter permease [Aquamicrobium sp. LC103]